MQRHRDLVTRPRVAALEHRPRQFLDEQRHAAGALDHRRDGFLRQCRAGGHLGHHRAHVARVQAVERDLRMMRPRRPWGAKLGARRVEEQQRRRRALLDQQLDQLQR